MTADSGIESNETHGDTTPGTWDSSVDRLLTFTSRPCRQSLSVRALTDESAVHVEGLYPFQSHIRTLLTSISDNPCNILVASPTGSGKTFAIEEAAQKALEIGKPIYVAQPLIALAEQVYSRLNGDQNERICLRTGPSCRGRSDQELVTICTYEVLSRACLKNPHLLRDAMLVIIDEIHYVASDRGPAIIEILHSCPATPLIALSGTLPNQTQFGNFVASINSLPTYITGAKRRPVPVSYFTYDSK